MSSAEQQTRSKGNSASAGSRKPTGNQPGTPKGLGQAMPPGKTWLWLLGVLVANYLLVRLLLPSPEAPASPMAVLRTTPRKAAAIPSQR